MYAHSDLSLCCPHLKEHESTTKYTLLKDLKVRTHSGFLCCPFECGGFVFVDLLLIFALIVCESLVMFFL